MKLIAFRVEMYKSVLDSKWIHVSPLTTFVGKNEAGKTSLLKALHKLNPFRAESYSISSEWPRSHRQKRDTKHIVCRARFSLDQEEIAELTRIAGKAFLHTEVEVSRNYDGQLSVNGLDDHFSHEIPPLKIKEKAREDNFFEWPEFGAQVPDEFESAAIAVEDELEKLLYEDGDVEKFRSALSQKESDLEILIGSALTVPGAQATSYLSDFSEELTRISNELSNIRSTYEEAVAYISAAIPTFIYMDDYRAFSGTARLDEVFERQQKARQTPEDRSLLTILELSGLDLETEMAKASQATSEDAEQRQFDLDDASAKLTHEIEGRWKQKKYEVEFRADGQQFITFVKDSIGSSLIKLEERSKGFQWFFSFDLLFMYESKGEFKNCVILLDEPGLHLHPDAQKDLLRRLEYYALNNTLLYTTHLPFMIELRHPDRIRVVSESDSGTVVTEDLVSAQPEGRLTVQAALGMSGSSSYLLAQRNLVVEGVDDFWIISELSNLLIRSGEQGLDEDIFITAAQGASEATYIATFMIGQKLDVLVLFDTDRAGTFEEERLVKSWIALYQEPKMRILSLGPAAGSDRPEFALEDMFSDDFYLSFVKEAYKSEISTGGIKVSLKGKDQLCKKVERCFETAGATYNKGRVAKLIRKKLTQMKSIDELPEETKIKARTLMANIREAFS